MVYGSASVAEDGTIYFLSDKLYALNPDGSKKWEFFHEDIEPLGWDYIGADPAIGPDGVIYVVRSPSPPGRNRLFAVNPDGTSRWMAVGGYVASAIVGADGTVYCSKVYGGVAALNPDGVLKWEADVGNTVFSAPALAANGTLLMGETDSVRGTIHALDLQGSNVWQFAHQNQLLGSLAVGTNGDIYANFANWQGDTQRIAAVDSHGTLRWEYVVQELGSSSRVPATPALASDGTLYAASDRFLLALDSNGNRLWQFDAGSNALSSPLIGPDGTVYVAMMYNAGALFAVEGTGAGPAASQWPMARKDVYHRASLATELSVPPVPSGLAASFANYTDKVLVSWTSTPPATHYILMRSETPVLADAVVLTNTLTGRASFEDRSALPGVTYRYFVSAANVAGASPPAGPVTGQRRIATVGDPVWIFPTGKSVTGAPVVGTDGDIYFGCSDGHLYAVDAGGQPKWRFAFGGASCSTPSVGSDGTVYFSGEVSRYPVPITNALFAVDSSGQLRWRIVVDAQAVSGLAIGDDGTLYAGLTDSLVESRRRLVALSPDGSNVWTFANGKSFMTTPCIGADGTVYAGTTDGYIEAVRPDGTSLWECSTADGYLKTPVIGSNGVLFTAGASVHAINADGQLLWNNALQAGADSGPSCIASTGVIFAQADYTYYQFNADGSHVQKGTLPNSQDSTLRRVLRDSNGTVYLSVYSGYWSDSLTGRIYALSPTGAKEWEYSLFRVSFGNATLCTNNLLLVPASDGVYAMRTAAGLGNSAWPHPLHDPQHTGRATELPPLPVAPASVAATMRTRVTDVRVSWNSELGASSYDIFRAGTTNSAEAVLLGSVNGQLFFDDKSAVSETPYVYWVRAKNVSGGSSLSSPVSGMRRQAMSGELLYEWNLYGEIDTSPAIAEDGTVYVSVNLPVRNAPDAGRKVVAVRPDGTIWWQYLTTGINKLSSPSIGTNGTIYVGVQGVFPDPSLLLALNPDGTFRWQLVADDAIETAPAIARDGTIYAGSKRGTLYAATPEGDLVWTNSLQSSISALAVGRDGTVYCDSADGSLRAVRSNGLLMWRVPGGVASAVALGTDGAIYASCGGKGLKAFNPDGTLRWQQTNGTPFYAPTTIGLSNTIVVGTGDSSGSAVSCFNSAGSNVWNASGASLYAAAAIAMDGTAYLYGGGSNLFAFSATGSNIWRLPLATWSRSSPAIAPDGTIYLGGQDGKLRSVFGTSPLADTAWPMFQHDARHTGRDVHAPALPAPAAQISATDGTYNNRIQITWMTAASAGWYEVWRGTSTNGAEAVCLATNVAGTTQFDDKSAVPGTPCYYWVRSMNNFGSAPLSGPEFGYRRVAVPGEALGDSRPLAAAGTAPALGNNGDIYVGSANSAILYALTTELTNRWQFTLGSVSAPAVGEDGQVYVWSADNRFYGLDPGGAPAWWFAGLYELSLPAAVAADGALIIADRNQNVLCFDPTTQSWRWYFAVGSPITAAPAIGADGTVYVGSQDGQLHALNADGTLRWRFRTGGRIQSSPAVGSDGAVYFGSDDRGIYAVRPDGRRLWAAQASAIVSASPVIAPDGTVIIGSQDGWLYAFSPEGAELWRFAASGAIHASACVGADGTVYFGTYNGWVHALNRAGQPVWSFNPATNGLSGRAVYSPLLLEDRLLVPISSAGLQALAVSAGPAEVNWPQYRHDAQRTARARTWLTATLPDTPGIVAGEALTVTADLAFAGHVNTHLELLSGTNVLATTSGPVPTITWSPVVEGKYLLHLRAVDEMGNLHSSAPFRVEIAPRPRLSILTPPSTGARLVVQTVAGRRYQVQRSDDLQSWRPAGEFTAAESLQVWTDPESPAGASYYRVTLLP